MKSVNKITSVFSLCLGLILAPTFSQAKDLGPGDGGGGNAQVAEFFQLAISFQEIMQNNPGIVPAGFPLDRLSTVMKQLKVEAVKGPLILDEVLVDAINYPARGKVDIDNEAWDKRSEKKKYQLVIHELLGLLRISDEQYQNSRKLFAATESFVGTSLESIAKREVKFSRAVDCDSANLCDTSFLAKFSPRPTCEAYPQLAKKLTIISERFALAECNASGAKGCRILGSVPFNHLYYGICVVKATAGGYLAPAQ